MFDRRKILSPAIIVFSLLLLAIAVGCTAKKTSSPNNQSNAATPTPANSTTPATPAPATPQAGQLSPGEASGSCTARGETVTLKYAYEDSVGKRSG